MDNDNFFQCGPSLGLSRFDLRNVPGGNAAGGAGTAAEERSAFWGNLGVVAGALARDDLEEGDAEEEDGKDGECKDGGSVGGRSRGRAESWRHLLWTGDVEGV